MDEMRRSSDCSGTFSGKGRVTGERPPSAIQEIYDFLFFKLYLLSGSDHELLLKLWHPAIFKRIAAMVPSSSRVLQ